MKTLLYLLLFSALCNSAFAEKDYSSDKLSDNKHFQVSYESKLEPIEINNLHAWIIHIKDSNGKDITDAEIEIVNGGMPEHNHGFPTQPQITKNFANGCYLLEGLKFHMMGWWTLSLSITQKDISDTVTFNLKL